MSQEGCSGARAPEAVAMAGREREECETTLSVDCYWGGFFSVKMSDAGLHG